MHALVRSGLSEILAKPPGLVINRVCFASAYSDGKDFQSILPAHLFTSSGKLRVASRNKSITWRCFCFKRDLQSELKVKFYGQSPRKLGQRTTLRSFFFACVMLSMMTLCFRNFALTILLRARAALADTDSRDDTRVMAVGVDS
jgi:hypothetical protein